MQILSTSAGALARTLALLLPAVFPSWRFFQTVAPSPRIEVRRGGHTDWAEFQPRPARITWAEMLRRLLWNPHWNAHLFLVSCAERWVAEPSQHSLDQIHRYVAQAIADPAAQFEIRLVFVHREGVDLVKTVAHQGAPVTVAEVLR